VGTARPPASELAAVLISLKEIGEAINRAAAAEQPAVEATLRQVAEGAARLAPGSTAAVYLYDTVQQGLSPTAAAVAGPEEGAPSGATGLGVCALAQGQRLLASDGHGAVACLPLQAGEQWVGVLQVRLPGERHFHELELLALDNLAGQAALAAYHALHRARVQRDLARKEGELTRLRRAGLLISSRLRLEETLESILQMALEVTNARYGIFRLADKTGQNLVMRAIAGEKLSRPLIEALPIQSTSIMSWVARHREPLCIPDLRADPWAQIYYPLDHDLEMRSELAVPLIGASGRLEGVLNLESPVPAAFDEQDSHLLQALATQAMIAIQEVRLLDAIQEMAGWLLTQAPAEVLARLVEVACELLGASASAIWVLQGEELVLQAASAGYEHGERLPLRDSLVGQAIVGRGPVLSADVRTDPRFNRPDLARAHGWVRMLVEPMLASDDREPVGAFAVYSAGSDPGRFAESEWDKKVLTCLAHYAALAVHNASRQEALRSAQEQRAVAETFAAVGDIAANLLHHLNNKVGAIPVRIEGIQDKCQAALQADPYLAANLAEIERSAAEAMEAVRDSLFHLRPIRLQPVDLAVCVASAIAAANLPADVQVQTAGLEDLPEVVASERSVALVFTNLLENAREAMDGRGVVSIRGAMDGGWVQVTVSDSGPGIAPDLHNRIFELDFSGRGSTQAGKLGFGLWWVKTLMTRLGGAVSVESDGRNGTAFHLRLPRAEVRP